MKINFSKSNIILKIIAIVITLIMNISIYFVVGDIKVSIILLFFSVLIVSILFINERLYKNYMEDMFIQLSDMLTTIIDMKDNEIFPTIKDDLFSKLQHQTIKLTRILKNQKKQIEDERNEIKTLISDIAHQLKTPLTNLKMYGEFLQDETLSDDERKEFTEIILLSLNRLNFLIESMIKMSRLESGVIQLKPRRSNLNDTILIAINEIKKKANAKGTKIYLKEIDKVEITHDKNWISEAFFNILENAVKYTDENGIIEISIISYEIFVRVDIKDNGMGIKEEEIPKIFLRFYRGENVGDLEGIGIGLYLTREIISKNGGYIKVNSNNDGTTFSIFLPKK